MTLILSRLVAFNEHIEWCLIVGYFALSNLYIFILTERRVNLCLCAINIAHNVNVLSLQT